MKHTSKPLEKSVKPVEVVESKGSETPCETKPTSKGTMCAPIISDDKLKAATPGNLLYVAKCNLGKVNLESMRPAVFLTNMHAGWPQVFALPCADESAVFAICSCFAIIA